MLIPFIVGGAMKLPPEQMALLISTIFFTSGLCTLIQQSPIGNRLPVIQGGTFSFLGPTFAIIGMVAAKKITGDVPLWQLQIQEVAGAIMIASVVEILLGYTGILQTCNGTTTYSENIGSIGLTKVASRRVILCGVIAMLIIPIIGKFGALLASLPQPVVGAMFVVFSG